MRALGDGFCSCLWPHPWASGLQPVVCGGGRHRWGPVSDAAEGLSSEQNFSAHSSEASALPSENCHLRRSEQLDLEGRHTVLGHPHAWVFTGNTDTLIRNSSP